MSHCSSCLKYSLRRGSSSAGGAHHRARLRHTPSPIVITCLSKPDSCRGASLDPAALFHSSLPDPPTHPLPTAPNWRPAASRSPSPLSPIPLPTHCPRLGIKSPAPLAVAVIIAPTRTPTRVVAVGHRGFKSPAPSSSSSHCSRTARRCACSRRPCTSARCAGRAPCAPSARCP